MNGRRAMKTEGKIRTGIFRTALITIAAAGVLVLFAFAAPEQAMAGSVEVPAPTETANIRLGVNDPPASATLKGWYCTDTPLKKTIAALVGSVDEGFMIDLQVAVERAVDWEFKFIKKGWPFKLAGMHESPVKNGLDAPPGGTKTYKFKCCYTKAELQAVHDKVVVWIGAVEKGTLIEGKGVDRELHIKYLGYPKNYR